MKKARLSLLFTFLFMLSACSSGPSVETTPSPSVGPTPSEAVQSVEPVEDNPLLAADFQVYDNLSGSGKKLGERGRVNVSRDLLPEVSSPEFADMLSEFADQRVSGGGFDYVTIDFRDEKDMGLVFLGGENYADYCVIGAEGVVGGASYGHFIRDSVGEVFSFVDYGVREISNFTWQHEAIVGENYFLPAREEAFSSSAEENGLSGAALYASGVVVDRLDLSHYDTLKIETEYGNLYASKVSISFEEVEIGDEVTVFFLYNDWEDGVGVLGKYVYHE